MPITKWTTFFFKLSIILSIAFACYSTFAYESNVISSIDILDEEIFNNIIKSFTFALKHLQDKIIDRANFLFWSLTSISVVLLGVKLIFSPNGGIQSFFGAFVQLCIVTGFFYFCLQNGPDIAVSILDSFIMLPNENMATPSAFFDVINTCADAMLRKTEMNILKIPYEIACLTLVLFFRFLLYNVVINYLVIYIIAYIFCTAGMIAIAFSALETTRFIAYNYIWQVLSSGLELMSIIIVTTAGLEVVTALTENIMKTETTMNLELIAKACFIAWLILKCSIVLPLIMSKLVQMSPLSPIGSRDYTKVIFNSNIIRDLFPRK